MQLKGACVEASNQLRGETPISTTPSNTSPATTAAGLKPAAPDSNRLIASPWHTLIVILLLALNTYRGIWQATQSRSGSGPSRPLLYGIILIFELLFLGIVGAGVRLRGVSFQTILGRQWQSAKDVFRDVGLGVCLLLLSTVLASVLGGHQHDGAQNQAIGHLIPQTSLELALWMVVSLAAGVCEEAVYRGYLQRQLGVLTRSVPVGIVLSAIAFGGAHLYQGLRRATVIAASGVLFGLFANWRKSVRPGMVAHTLQDAVAPFLLKVAGR